MIKSFTRTTRIRFSGLIVISLLFCCLFSTSAWGETQAKQVSQTGQVSPNTDTSGVMDWAIVNTKEGILLTGSLLQMKTVDELNLWIIGDSTRRYETITVDDPEQISYTIPWDLSDGFSEENVHIYIQHPGKNGEMEVYPNNPLIPTAILYDDKVQGKRGLTLVPLTGSDAPDLDEITEKLTGIITSPEETGTDDAWVSFYTTSSSPETISAPVTSETEQEPDNGVTVPEDNTGNSMSAEDLLIRGITLAEVGKYSEALSYYEEVLRADPDNIIAWNNKGATLNELRQYEDAVLAFNQGLHIDPKNAEIWCNKGNALYNLKRYTEAISAYEKALSYDPTNSDARNYKNRAVEKLNNQ